MAALSSELDGFPTWFETVVSRFSAEKQETVLDFIEYLEVKGNSEHSIETYLKSIAKLDYNGKKFEEMTREDLINWKRKLPKMAENGGEYAEASVATFQNHARAFLKWVHSEKGPDTPLEDMESPEFLECLHTKHTNSKLPKNILSKEEVKKLVEAANHQRDRALIFVTYESGTRASEVLGLHIEDVEIDKHGAVILVDGKTGERRIRIVESVPELELWLDMKEGTKPQDPFWPSLRGDNPLSISGLEKMLNTVAERAELNKNVYPHLLRHSRATHLANVLTEAQMREFFGWSKSSDTPAKYVHLAGRDVDSALLEHYGIEEENKEKDEALKPQECPRCGKKNSTEAKFCSRCSMPLNEDVAAKFTKNNEMKEEVVQKVMDRLISDAPEMVEEAIKETQAKEDMEKIVGQGGNTEQSVC